MKDSHMVVPVINFLVRVAFTSLIISLSSCKASFTTFKKGSKKVREKSRECHNYKPQPFSDPKRKRKPTNVNKQKPNKRTKSTKISSLFPKVCGLHCHVHCSVSSSLIASFGGIVGLTDLEGP